MTHFRVNKLFLFKGKCGKGNYDNNCNNVVVQQLQQHGDGFQFVFFPENIEATTTTCAITTTAITTTAIPTTTTSATTAGFLFFNVLEGDIIQ